MMRYGRVAILLLAFSHSTAWACGHCVEDRIAAVYDHALILSTQARKQQIAYFAWDGALARDQASRLKLLTLIDDTPGVDKGSTHLSMEPAAFAVVFDPRRSSGPALEAALRNKLRAMKVSVHLLQPPSQAPPSNKRY